MKTLNQLTEEAQEARKRELVKSGIAEIIKEK